MSNPVQVEVVLSGSERLPVVDVWLVVDVLRASTVIVSWFAAGGDELYPAGSVADARLLAERLVQEGKSPVLMGEQNAIAPQGFDLGNSPLEITQELTQKNPCAVMATTNGTAALLKAASTGAPVFAACARNAPAALSAALARGSRIGILCSGRKGRPAWDDTLCAGLMTAYLTERFTGVRLADSARLAHLVWTTSKNFKASLTSADHAVFLDKIGYGDDIAYAAEVGVTQTVPQLFELPDGEGMRAVLRLPGPGEQEGPQHSWTLPVSRGLARAERAEELQYPVVSSSIWQKEGLFSSKAGAAEPSAAKPAVSADNVFFTGAKQRKPRKGGFIIK